MEVGRRKKSVGCATSTENIVSEALVEDRPSAVYLKTDRGCALLFATRAAIRSLFLTLGPG